MFLCIVDNYLKLVYKDGDGILKTTQGVRS